MPTLVEVPVTQLVLDEENARFSDPVDGQQEAYTALAELQGRKLVALAKDILDHGLDPTTLPAVIATEDRRRRYRVIEGNRRVLALKALETPSLVLNSLTTGDQKLLKEYATQYSKDPIDEVTCVLFDAAEAEEATHWIAMRHTGSNDGAGLVEWDSDEKNRFEARHGGASKRNVGGQATDFLKDLDGNVPRIPTSTLTRLLRYAAVRESLGLSLSNGQLQSRYPKSEVAKGLRKMVADLHDKTITVVDVYTAPAGLKYVEGFDTSELPDPATALPDSLALDQLPAAPPKAPGGRGRRKQKQKPKLQPPRARSSVVAPGCEINPTVPRINSVFNELAELDAATYPNSASVLFRVFLELSVDHHLEQHNLMTEAERRNSPLAKRLKAAARDLNGKGRIADQLLTAIEQVANSQHTLAAGVTTFNQYVHNPYVFPKPTELFTTWDQLQPFLEQVWA